MRFRAQPKLLVPRLDLAKVTAEGSKKEVTTGYLALHRVSPSRGEPEVL
jgi:hypothetical protein